MSKCCIDCMLMTPGTTTVWKCSLTTTWWTRPATDWQRAARQASVWRTPSVTRGQNPSTTARAFQIKVIILSLFVCLFFFLFLWFFNWFYYIYFCWSLVLLCKAGYLLVNSSRSSSRHISVSRDNGKTSLLAV